MNILKILMAASKKLNFDSQTGSFSVGNTITGGTSGSRARIIAIQDDGADGILTLTGVTRLFLDNEIVCESALGGELLDEGGFENFVGTEDDGTSDNFTGWLENQVNDENGDKVEATATKHSGSYALKLTKTTTAFVGVMSGVGDVAVVAEKYHVLSFYTRGDGSADGYYSIYDRSNGVYIAATLRTYMSGTSYAQFNYYFKTPVGCTTIDVHLRGYQTGTVYFDSVSVKQITNAALANGMLY